ncbi:MAG: hypothetical protein Q9193_006030 [Seirophora villosa]
MRHSSPENSHVSAEVSQTPELVPPDSDEMQDVFRIIPLNKEARRSFDGVAQSAIDGSLDPLHAQYLHITGKGPLGYDSEGVDARKSNGETTDDDPGEPPTMVHAGYYRVHFALPSVIGRGSGKKFGPTRNVDILLLAPGTKTRQKVVAAHLLLGLHTQSGVWRMTAGAEVKVEDEIRLAGQSAFLHRPRTRIEIFDMQYSIRFEISTPSQEAEYLKARNKMLRKEGITLPHTDISGIPVPGDTVFDSIVFRHGIGSGSFGSVYEGFGPTNGSLRVAKRIILKSTQQVPEVDREIQALERFNGCVGIIKLIDWRTALNSKELSVAHYPLDVYLIHEKGVAFNKFDWDTVSWDIKQSLCYQLLVGLTAIHEAGCMHRDITPMNILVFPYEDPPQATLCDFGKFCDTPTHTDTRLAGWQFLPPELQKDRRQPYDQKLDIWMLGLALSYSWWPQTMGLHPREVHDYRNMQQVLGNDKNGDGLGDLIAGMMASNPGKRPSAADALKHKTLRQCSTGSAAPTRGKRPHDGSG